MKEVEKILIELEVKPKKLNGEYNLNKSFKKVSYVPYEDTFKSLKTIVDFYQFGSRTKEVFGCDYFVLISIINRSEKNSKKGRFFSEKTP